MLEVSELFIYPVKSLGGISVRTAKITDRGFQYDRRWMLIDTNNRFLSQREVPQMALLQVQVSDAGLSIHHKINKEEKAYIPERFENTQTFPVQIWDDTCTAELVDPMLDEWFSSMLSRPCRLVYMPDSSKRMVDPRYASDKQVTNFSDAYPFLIIGQASLDELNTRLQDPLPMNRFRPNIVFTGGEPFEEDLMAHFSINNIQFYGVKLCARCNITTINQDNTTRAKEPLKTLASYRQKDNKIYFGQNLLHTGEGEVQVGHDIMIHQFKKPYLIS